MRTRGGVRRPAWLAVCAAISVSAAAARAQDLGLDAQPAPAPPSQPPAAAPAPKNPVTLPAEKTADLQTHWNARRDFLRDRDDRRAGEEEQRVLALGDELGLENLFFLSGALVREGLEALSTGAPVVAVDRCRRAVELAPALPAAHACLARALFADSPGNVKAALGEVSASVRATLADPRASRAATANALAVALTGLLLAGFAWSLLLFARHSRLFFHDARHVLPAGARAWQGFALAGGLLALPILLQAGPVALLVLLLAAAALYASGVERGIACAVLVLVALLPWAATGIAQVASFGGPGADAWLIEHGEGSPAALRRLQLRFETAPDLPVAFVLARKAKREGDLAAAEALYRRALELGPSPAEALVRVHNNLGNVLVLRGDTAAALLEYQAAIELKDSFAAPHFNVSRALNLGGVETLEKVQTEQTRAIELDRDAVDRFTGGKLQASFKANKFVMDLPVDEALLRPLFAEGAGLAGQVGDEVRATIGWGLPLGLAPGLPLAGVALVLLLGLASRPLRPSGRCERCGREVCRRCDPDARPAENLCAQCVNVFIRRSGVDAPERIRKEYAVQAFQRRRWTMGRVAGLLAGAGHVLLGYPLRGAIFLAVSCELLSVLLLSRGVAHDPFAVHGATPALRLVLALVALAALSAICLRDLIARQHAEGA